MLRPAHILAVAGGLAVSTLVGCNAVLGIDEAHSRDDGSAVSTSLAIPVAGCDVPRTACSTCIASSNALAACMADHKCRKALDAYRQCLGSKCDDSTCFDAFTNSAGQPVADVVSAECPMCEGNTPLASMCDLYCACMEAPLPPKAPGESPDGMTCETVNPKLGWTVGVMASCTDACKKLAATDLASVNCRWGHCELAANGEARGHCQHAIDDSICPLSATLDPNCKDRSLTGWACDVDRDCCTNHCVGNICAQ